MYSNNNSENLLNALSLIIGLQNLQENREQSAQNNVQAANDQQAKYILNEIHKEFQKQNELLYKILELLENN